MLQKRRDECRKQVRRLSLQRYFRNCRTEMLGAVSFEQALQEYQQTSRMGEIRNIVVEIDRALSHHDYEVTLSLLHSILQASINDPGQCAVEIQLESSCLRRALKRMLLNEGHLNPNTNQWAQIPQRICQKLAELSISVLATITYRAASEQHFFQVADGFWRVFEEGFDLYGQDMRWFQGVMTVLRRMFEGGSSVVWSVLKGLGIGSQLGKIINHETDKLESESQISLMGVIKRYLDLEGRQQEMTPNDINGTTLVGCENAEKQVLLVYCLHIVHSGLGPALYDALFSIDQIFILNQYLVHSICEKSVFEITELISCKDRAMRQKALEVIDDINYFNITINVPIVTKTCLLDQLHGVLLEELAVADKITESIVNVISHLLTTLTQLEGKDKEDNRFKAYERLTLQERKYHKQVLQRMCEHPIWDLAFQHIAQHSPLFGLVKVFTFYIEVLPGEKAMRVLESFIGAVAQLEWKYLPRHIYESIKETIRRQFYQKHDFGPEREEEMIVAWLQHNQILHHFPVIIEEFGLDDSEVVRDVI